MVKLLYVVHHCKTVTLSNAGGAKGDCQKKGVRELTLLLLRNVLKMRKTCDSLMFDVVDVSSVNETTTTPYAIAIVFCLYVTRAECINQQNQYQTIESLVRGSCHKMKKAEMLLVIRHPFQCSKKQQRRGEKLMIF